MDAPRSGASCVSRKWTQLLVVSSVCPPVLISFAIPAHNEEGLLPATLAAIHDAGRELGIQYEIVVASDASTDRTAEVASTLGARVVSIESRRIAAARNAAARAARGDMLIFVDADTSVTTGAVREAIAAIDQRVVGGGAMVRFDGQVPMWARCMMAVTIVLFRFFKYTGGCFLFCSRSAFESAGGWNEDFFAGEEIEMARALKRVGKFVIVRTHVVTSGRKLRTYSLWEVVGTFVKLGLSPRRSVRSREKLDIWYGPRREDPGGGSAT